MDRLKDFKPFTVKGTIEVEVEIPVYFKGDIDTEYWDILELADQLVDQNISYNGNKHAKVKVVNTEGLEVEEGI